MEQMLDQLVGKICKGRLFFLVVCVLFGISVRADEALLKNGSFEKIGTGGCPDEWHMSQYPGPEKTTGKANVVIANGGTDGEKEVRIRKENGVDWCYIQQFIPHSLAVGDTYVFSVWMKADKPAKVNMYFSAVPLTRGIKHQGVRKRKIVTPKWKQYHVSLTVNDDAKYIKLRCVLQLYTSNVTLFVDDANVKQKSRNKGFFRNVTSSIIGAVRTDSPPVIDGKLDEACWKKAGKAQNFLGLEKRFGSKSWIC